MDKAYLQARAVNHLQTLCHQIPNRRLGSEGNRLATRYFGDVLKDLGFEATFQSFDCLDWMDKGASLAAKGVPYEVFSSPYSLGCNLTAKLVVAQSIDELSTLTPGEGMLLLLGEIVREQLMPKQFPFYNPEHHQQVYQLLEDKAPLAIITATSRNPELAGGMYPFPMIEDGDFNIPSVYMKDMHGMRLLSAAGEEIELEIKATRIPARGENVVARIGPPDADRIVFCAHIDAKDNTPGALDNGTGVAMLLLLAELLEGYSGQYALELVALNGEDHYSAQGQKEYLEQNQDQFEQMVLAINTDIAGFVEGYSAFSLYNCPAPVEAAVRRAMSAHEGVAEGEQWYQSDHSIFIQQGRPAMAITSDRFMELSQNITHTAKDDLNLVAPAKIVEVSLALREVIEQLEHQS